MHIDPKASVHKTAVLSGDVSIGAGTNVGPYVVISDSKIGENCEILPFSHIHTNSTIGDGCKIGCEVKKSTLGNKVNAKHGGTVVHSATVGDGSNFGAGVKCANYDGKGKGTFEIGENVSLGCNVVMSVRANEVTKIGSGVTIGALCHVNQDIPEDSLVYMDKNTGTLTVREGYYSEKS